MDKRIVESAQKSCRIGSTNTTVGLDLQILDTFACRLARKHIARQLVEADHHVLQTEERLILSVKDKLLNMTHGLIASGRSAKSVALAVYWRVVQMAKEHIMEIGVEEDMLVEAMNSIQIETNSTLTSLLGVETLNQLYCEENLS